VPSKDRYGVTKGSQRKHLRSQARHLKPLVTISAKGLTSQIIGSVNLALKDHELIKYSFFISRLPYSQPHGA
jgi:RNA-binding protein YhbY